MSEWSAAAAALSPAPVSASSSIAASRAASEASVSGTMASG